MEELSAKELESVQGGAGFFFAIGVFIARVANAGDDARRISGKNQATD